MPLILAYNSLPLQRSEVRIGCDPTLRHGPHYLTHTHADAFSVVTASVQCHVTDPLGRKSLEDRLLIHSVLFHSQYIPRTLFTRLFLCL